VNENELRNWTNAALLKERERYQIRLAGASRAAKYDKSLLVPLAQAREEAQMVEKEIKRRGIDDFLNQVPLL